MRIFKRFAQSGSGEDGSSYGRVSDELALANLDKRMSFITDDKKGTSVVELVKREGSTLGLIISGGINRGSRPKISNLRPGSVAHRSDALAVGDHLVAVNGIRTGKLKHEEIVNLLKNAGDKVTLEVEYEIPDSSENSFCACPKVIQVKLEKENGSFGFTLRGGACPDKLKSRPLVITHVRPGGPADRDATIKAGDKLLAIDGLNLASATLQQAMEVLKSLENDAILSIEYDVSIMDAVRNASGPLLVEIDRAPGTYLGITLTRLTQRADEVMIIESIMQASIAERCGALHVGDHILTIDGTRVDHMTSAEAMQLLKTSSGNVVKLEILPVSQMTTRRTHETNGFRIAYLPSTSHNAMSYNPYNTLSSYGGQSSASSMNYPLRQYSTPTYPTPKTGNSSRKNATNYVPAFYSTGTSPTVLNCGQLYHTEIAEVILHADQRGFGFTLQGSTFASELLGALPVISQVESGGPADRSGILHIADRLVTVNGLSVEGLSATEVFQIIQKSSSRIVLQIEFDVAESVVPSSGTFTVKLAKGTAGLGITITSPKVRKNGDPLIISDIKKGSAAHRTGTLQPGDKLLAIDSVRTDNCTVEDAAEILQACESGVVKLRIKKDDTFSEDPESSKGAVVFTVELIRHGGPLGITISGTEEPFEPIIISSLTEEGLAERTGALHVGDHLLAINGNTLRGKPLSEAILLLQNSGDIVNLKIAKFPIKRDSKDVVKSEAKNEAVAVTDRENIFVTPYVGQANSSVDSAVESWDSCGLDLLSGHQRVATLTQQSDRKSSPISKECQASNSTFISDEQLQLESESSEPNEISRRRSYRLPNEDWNGKCPDSSNHVKADWTNVLEDLETCGQSQLLRQIEQSIMGSQRSLCSPGNDNKISVEYDNVLAGSSNQRDDDGYKDEEDDDSSCRTTMIYSVNRPIFNSIGLENHKDDESLGRGGGGCYFAPSASPYSIGPIPIEVYRVTLFKDKVYEDFGFSVSDGLYERGVFVNRIREGGPADQSGILRRYDRILQVNDTKTQDYDCCLTVPLIAAAGDCIELLVSRPAYCNGNGHDRTSPFLRSNNSDCSNKSQSGKMQHPWVDDTDGEDCSSPIPPQYSNGTSSIGALLTKTL